MSFATQQDLEEWCGINGEAELIQLTDPQNLAIDTVLLAAKGEQADAEINARISGLNLPLTAPYPALLVNLHCKIWRYLLYTSGRPEHVSDDYKDAIKLLDAIRDGKATLGLAGDGTGPAAPNPDLPAFSAPDRVFTADTLADF